MLEPNNCIFTGRTSKGDELHGILVQLTRFELTVQIFLAPPHLQVSEVFKEVKITKDGKIAYKGRGVITDLYKTTIHQNCTISLHDPWEDLERSPSVENSGIGAQYRRHFADWQNYFRITSDYKLVIADIQTYLIELRSWLDQVESTFSSRQSIDPTYENQFLADLEKPCVAKLDQLFERFERVSLTVDPQYHPAHRVYARRHLHPYMLCAPFMYRTYFKPLGYAGDYEMVNMIVRNQFEGESLYAKIVNRWALEQPPVVAHRNRIVFLHQRLIDESVRLSPTRSGLRVLNLGCGPAAEIKRFMKSSELSDHAQFTLYDFNDETISHTQSVLHETKCIGNRRTQLCVEKKSVQQILKESGKKTPLAPAQQYDFVYCAGLFDYLSDSVCERIIGILYDWTAPGGLVLVTNVDLSNPRRNTMESVLEWNLIYRNNAQASKILPSDIPKNAITIHTETSGLNIVIEIRKPCHE